MRLLYRYLLFQHINYNLILVFTKKEYLKLKNELTCLAGMVLEQGFQVQSA